jgi:hypothetical protein
MLKVEPVLRQWSSDDSICFLGGLFLKGQPLCTATKNYEIFNFWVPGIVLKV